MNTDIPRRKRIDIIFSDIPKLVVGGFRPAEGIGAGWIPFDYELEGLSGTGVAAGSRHRGGELTLDLGLNGWHRLHFCLSPCLGVWLDGEKGFRELGCRHDGSVLTDAMLHTADMTGCKIHIATKGGAEPSGGILFYIRAEPCDGPRPSARNLIATEDGHDVFGFGMASHRDIRKWFYPYKDSDFFRVLWGPFAAGDCDSSPRSTHATPLPYPASAIFGEHGHHMAASIRRLQAQGDILATVVEAAREVGMELHFYIRVAAFAPLFPGGAASEFYRQNRRLRCRDEHGREVMRISYAWPETQAHMLAYFEDLLRYDPDGLCLAYNRGLPMMICEEPVLAAFKERWGRAPKLPDETDSPEMQLVRHELMAGFVTRVRDLLARRGKALSCIAPRNFEENKRRGLDLEMLVERGLFESVCIGAGHEDTRTFTDRHGLPPVDQNDFDPLARLKSFDTARVYGCLFGHGVAAGALSEPSVAPGNDPLFAPRRMRTMLDAGLDGAFYWDPRASFYHNPGQWDVIRRLGDRRFLEDALAGRLPPPPQRATLTIAGLRDDRYNPWNCG